MIWAVGVASVLVVVVVRRRRRRKGRAMTGDALVDVLQLRVIPTERWRPKAKGGDLWL